MRLRLGEILVQERLLSPERLRELLLYQREHEGRLGSILVGLGLLPETAVARALSQQCGLPAVCLAGSSIATEVLNLVPSQIVRSCRALPLELDGDVLRVALAEPSDRDVRAVTLRLALATGKQILPCIAVQATLDASIHRAYSETRPSRLLGPPRWILASETQAEAVHGRGLDRGAPPLIPRAALFGHPAVSDVALSPDGRHVSFIGAKGGARVIRVAPVDDVDRQTTVASDDAIALRWHTWAHNGRHLLYGGDANGNERQQVYSVDTRTGRTRHLTKFGSLFGSASPQDATLDSEVVSMSFEHPDEVLIQMIHPGPTAAEVYRVHVCSGRRKQISPPDVSGFSYGVQRYWADRRYRVKLCLYREDHRDVVYARPGTDWQPVLAIPANARHSTRLVEFDDVGGCLFFIDGSSDALAHLVRLDLETGERKVVATPKYADIEEAIIENGEVKGVVEYHPRFSLRIFCPKLRREFDFLRSVADGYPWIVDRSADDRRWLVKYIDDRRPARYFVYDRGRRDVRFLFDARPSLSRYALAKMKPVNVTARDGLRLPCYLTLPRWPRKKAPVPMVVLVHGGPTSRDYWGFDAEHQWLANRGYAVLSVNYRGSTGFGARLRDATPYWIAPEMMEDVVDATRWAIRKGIADERRIGIMGASYGGYLALQGLAFTPGLFACAVSLCGVSNWRGMVGDRWSAETLQLDQHGARALVEKRSPLFSAGAIRKPLLVAHGVNDVRVAQAESDQITEALVGRSQPVTYLEYPGEGHGLYRQANRRSYYAIVEAFLATHLGGRLEALGNDLEGTSLRIAEGSEHVPGLAAFWNVSALIDYAATTGTETLDLSNRKLRELPPSVGKLTGLRKLCLRRNHLTRLPPEIGTLSNLEVLDLGDNQLMRLPDAIGSLHRLRQLDLSNNHLPELPVSLRSLAHLRNLVVEGNPLSPSSLWGFRTRVFRRPQ